MNEILFREALPADIPQAAKLIHDMRVAHLPEVSGVLNAEYLTKLDPEDELRQLSVNSDALLLVALSGGKVVGVASVKIEENTEKMYPFKRYGFYDNLVVGKNFRGHGVASEFHRLRAKFLKKKNVKVCKSQVFSFNEPVQKLVEKHGFHEGYRMYFKFLD